MNEKTSYVKIILFIITLAILVTTCIRYVTVWRISKESTQFNGTTLYPFIASNSGKFEINLSSLVISGLIIVIIISILTLTIMKWTSIAFIGTFTVLLLSTLNLIILYNPTIRIVEDRLFLLTETQPSLQTEYKAFNLLNKDGLDTITAKSFPNNQLENKRFIPIHAETKDNKPIEVIEGEKTKRIPVTTNPYFLVKEDSKIKTTYLQNATAYNIDLPILPIDESSKLQNVYQVRPLTTEVFHFHVTASAQHPVTINAIYKGEQIPIIHEPARQTPDKQIYSGSIMIEQGELAYMNVQTKEAVDVKVTTTPYN